MTETSDQTDIGPRDSALCDDFVDPTSSSDIDPQINDIATPAMTSTEFNEHDFENSRNESRTTIGQAGSQARLVGPPTPFGFSPTRLSASPVLHYTNPPSRRASLSQRLSSRPRVLHDEQTQEQRTIDYLQANGLELASTRGRARVEPSPNNNKSGLSKVDRIARMLNGIRTPENDMHTTRALSPAPQPGVSDGETRRRSLSRTRRVLHRIKARRLNDRPGEDDVFASVTDLISSEQSTSFQTRRAQEGANWFSGSRAAKTLPPGFEPPEGLRESLGANKSGSLRGRSSRSASLRLRNYRLPPAYALPSEQTALVVGSALIPNREVIGDGLPHDTLSLSSSAASLVSNLEEDYQPVPAPLNVSQRAPHGLIAETSMSGALPGPEQGSDRGSLFNEVIEGVDRGAVPSVPPKNPDRASGRNSALLVNRRSAVSPIPQPVPESLPPAAPAKKHKEIPWTSFGTFVLVWLVATALTLFGISRMSPLDSHAPACTLEQFQTCTPPSLSFKHNLRLNTTLPSTLRPYLASLQLNDIEDQILTDRGIDISAEDATSRMKVQGGLAFTTLFSDDGVSLFSDITYAGAIDGDGDDKNARSKLGVLMKQNNGDSKRKMIKVVSTHGTSHTMSVGTTIALSGQLFFALWLGCVLAVELALFCYFVVLPVLGAGIMLLWCDWLRRGRCALVGEGFWKHEIVIVSRLAFLCVLTGALGTVGASGILIAFWT